MIREITRKVFKSEKGDELIFAYFLVSTFSIEFSCYTYGIKVKDVLSDDEVLIEDISPSKDEVLDMINMLANYFVTTITARDVVLDYLGRADCIKSGK